MTHMWGACVSFLDCCLPLELVWSYVQQAQPAAAINLIGSEVLYVGEIVFSDSLLEFMAHIHRHIEMLSAV